MSLLARCIVVPALVGCWLSTPGPAAALVPEVKDEAGFFKTETIKKANAEIKAIRARHKKDVLVETYTTVPGNKVRQVREMSGPEREEFFDTWVNERARAVKLDGILVLICKSPGRVQIAVDNQTRKKAFTDADRAKLRKLLLATFNDKKYDEGLLEGLRLVHNTLDGKLGAAPVAPTAERPEGARSATAPAAASTNWASWLCLGVIVLLGVWLVVALIRAFSGQGGAAGGAGYGYGGGGGFLTGLLGGLFGAMAGSWIYHNLFGGGHSDWGASSAHAADQGDAGTDVDRDYSSSGGDFGDDTGSDIDAGGDFGEGDFGGGDFGGGGDF